MNEKSATLNSLFVLRLFHGLDACPFEGLNVIYFYQVEFLDVYTRGLAVDKM